MVVADLVVKSTNEWEIGTSLNLFTGKIFCLKTHGANNGNITNDNAWRPSKLLFQYGERWVQGVPNVWDGKLGPGTETVELYFPCKAKFRVMNKIEK